MRHPLALLLLAAALGAAEVLPEKIVFNRDIRPILADKCFHCHGPDPGTRKAGLRLDTEAGFFIAAESGDAPVVKGDAAKSPLYQRLITKDKDDLMPPPESHKELKEHEIALLKAWIAQGAPWQPHWSFIPPVKAPLPEVKDAAWAKNPVDRFILARLEQAGLKPEPEADARSLIRRVSLDLIGLPPSPDLIARHLPKDGARLSDAALGKLIDELMAMPAYGEHRARYWLDAARYSDTHGLHFDKYREIWPYRDWVIKAFNRNQPFDQFTVEQLAGDLLPNPTEEQLIATGLQRCNITTNEGGTIAEENLANYAADRVQTMGWVYLGLLTNCAQCHDHKFDPVTARDYYSMAAFFRNTTQGALDGNVKDGRGPILVIPTDADRPRWNALKQEIPAAQAALAEQRKSAAPEIAAWLKAVKAEDLQKDVAEGLLARFPLDEGKGVPAGTKSAGTVEWKKDGKLGAAPAVKKGSTLELGEAGRFDTMKPFSVAAWVRVAKAEGTGTIVARMEDRNAARGWSLFQGGRNYGFYLISKWPDDAIKVTTTRPSVRPGAWQHLVLTYDGKGKAGGLTLYVDGVRTEIRAEIDKLKTASVSETPTFVGQRSQSEFLDGEVQDVRFYGRRLDARDAGLVFKVGPLARAVAMGKPNAQQQAALGEHYLATRHQGFRKAGDAVTRLTSEQEMIKNRSPITHIQEEKKDSEPFAHILLRGAYDKPGEKVTAAIPAVLGKLPEGEPRNRLGLARWIVSPANPLTARVTVNRMWQELFGQGIVKTSEDFGIMGTPPTHPELLDWLAVDFRENGWDVKHLYRLLLTSAAYRQAAVMTPEKLAKDRDNSLVSRGPRFRMDGEMIRDLALAASGTLSPRMYGPGTLPYQPENIWEVVGMGTEKYVQDKGENLYRRTVYNFWKRMAAPANLDIFNAPSREMSCVRRDRTNTPLQALVAMNDPQFVEAARNLAQRVFMAGPTEDARLQAAAVRVLSRTLREDELKVLRGSLKELRAHYAGRQAEAEALLKVGESKPQAEVPAAELAAWTMVCSQLLNLDETITK